MLQIKNICKEYRTGTLVQKALDGVSLNLRDNEFVAILGPSGSGKTTLLNIIGGLDRYDSGDLIINGISTKRYKDRDWDSYRNHTIGFVFQSYNLIPHQTLLANVELALTISGVGKTERRARAQKALEQVGLGNQVHKKPNQLSGGQMQRVAIARALVNDPDILLADEPTGALDSDTSVQVMELLKQVAQDRLVVMVTHNPELAHEYATRIVNLRDGKIRSDSDPYRVNEAKLTRPEHKNMGKSSMSFRTALSLSFNNLRTKKARTLLTAFAGSIGIIGIALILSLSTGVNNYIEQIEEETLSEYPLQIQSTGFDLSSIMDTAGGSTTEEDGAIYVIETVTNLFSTMDSNDLEALKAYLDSGESGIEEYITAIEYSYDVEPQIYMEYGDDIRQVNPGSFLSSLGISSSSSSSIMSSLLSTNVFYEMPENEQLYENQYDVKAGRWPESYNECVLVLTSQGGISDFLLYTLGLRDPLELDEMIEQFISGEDVDVQDDLGTYDYEDILGITFKLVNSADYYVYDSQYGVWTDKSGDEDYLRDLVENGEELTIVGIVQPSEDANASSLSAGINYPASLTEYIVESAAETEIVKQQMADSSVNVFTGEAFGEESSDDFDMESLVTIDADKLQEAISFDEEAFAGLGDSLDFSDVFSSVGDSVDLSDMIDLSGITIDLPDMEQMELGDMMGSFDLSITSGDFSQLTESLMEGYAEYAKDHLEIDYSGLAESFQDYLKTDAAQAVIKAEILQIIEAGGGVSVTSSQISALLSELKSGFVSYIGAVSAPEEGWTAETLYEELEAYVQTDAVLETINTWMGDRLTEALQNMTVSDAQITELAAALAAGYQQYAGDEGGLDLTQIGQSFSDYLETDAAQEIISEGIAFAVDMDAVESQITSSVESYVQSIMTAYGNAISEAMESQISSAMSQMMSQITSGMSSAMSQAMTEAMAEMSSSLEDALSIDVDAFAEAFEMNMTGDELIELMTSMSSSESTTYESNLSALGYVDFDVPSGIDIYPKDFASKEAVISILDEYNSRMEEEGNEDQVITYTDVVGTLMSSVTDIIDIISYVLIAFVAISLIVSSIMIGVITYISVLERKKEIGILRAIGASKRNISQVFNAETFIIGFCAGALGILIALLLLIPGNALIHYLAGTTSVNAVLPVLPAVVLILLSVVLTLIGGLIPSKKAAKSDPVTALRTE